MGFSRCLVTGLKKSFGDVSVRPRADALSVASSLTPFTEAAASGDLCEVERRLQCRHCHKTERAGLFGPPSMGLMSKTCTACQGTGLNTSAEGKLDWALILACQGGHAEVVSLLLEKGADTEARATNGDLALVRAVVGNHAHVVSLLLSAKADANGVGCDRRTPLQIAADQGNAEVVKLIIDSGVDLNHTGSPDGTPALCTAAFRGHSNIVSMLVAARADLECRATASLNATPLIAASCAGHSKIAAELVAAGADVEARGHLGRTALCGAVKGKHCDVSATLLAARADAFAKSNSGASPHSIAREHGGEVFRLLQGYTADS